MWIQLEGDKNYWVEFQYERLPDFCFVCSKLGHVQKDCKLLRYCARLMENNMVCGFEWDPWDRNW